MSVRSNPEPVQAVVTPRRSLPSGTRFVWGLVLLLLIISLIVRVQKARTQAALAEHQISMHDAPTVFEERLNLVAPPLRQAEALRLAQDVSPGLRYASIDALAEKLTPATLDAIEQAFTDNASEVRKRAMETLIDVDKEGIRGPRLLLAATRDGDSWIREDALAQINMRIGRPNSRVDKRFVPALVAALGDQDTAVCSTAANALSKLTGNHWKFSLLSSPVKRQAVIAQWRQWWLDAQKDWPLAPAWTNVSPIIPLRSDPAPEFVQEDTQGQSLSNDDLHGKITLLSFWATWCGPCKMEASDLMKIQDGYKDRHVTVVGMACSEKSKEDLLGWCHDNHIMYRQCMATSEVRKAFGDIEEVLVSFLIDAQSRIRYRWDGERDYATFQSAVDRLLREDISQQQGVSKQ